MTPRTRWASSELTTFSENQRFNGFHESAAKTGFLFKMPGAPERETRFFYAETPFCSRVIPSVLKVQAHRDFDVVGALC
jgi:hypothetical protein